MLDRKEILKSCLEGFQPCVECDTVDGVDVVSFGEENEPYVLNFQIDGDTLSVNIIDKDRKTIIDNYSETFESDEELKQKANDATVAYSVVLSAKPTVERKIESQEESTRRDEAVFHMKEIISGCKDFVDKYDHDYDEDDVDFDKDLRTAVINIDLNRSDIVDNMKTKLYEDSTPVDTPDRTGEIGSNQVIPNSTNTEEDIDEILRSASISQLLNAAANALHIKSSESEDEVVSRILDDIAVQAEELLDEFSSAIDE